MPVRIMEKLLVINCSPVITLKRKMVYRAWSIPGPYFIGGATEECRPDTTYKGEDLKEELFIKYRL